MLDLRKIPEQIGSVQMYCIWEDLKCWGAWDTHYLIAGMVQKVAVLNNNASRARQGHWQSEGQGHCQHRSCSRGIARETFERQGAEHPRSFPKHVHTTLYQTELKRKVHGWYSDRNPLLENHVVWVICVTDSIGSSQQHLKGNVGNALPQMVQAFPWALVQETQRHIKRSTCHEQRREELYVWT